MKLIGITGKARAGKDTVANILWTYRAYTRIALADPLKMAAQNIFGLTDAETWNDDLKGVLIERWKMTPRQMLQKLGTEAIRGTFGSDVWVTRWLMTYEMLMNTDDIVVPDVRFDSEAKMIRDLGGVIVEVRRGDGLAGAEGRHASESGLSAPADFIINNDSSIDGLRDDVLSLLELV